MEEYFYIGLVKYKDKWRIFGDNTSRNLWGISFKTASVEEIPPKRQELLHIDESNIEDYLATFDAEIKQHEIIENPATNFITFVINFDEKVFVDGGGEDATYLSVKNLIPDDWGFIIDNPIFYVPESISNLWLEARTTNEDGSVLVSTATVLGAVHFKAKWRFYCLHNYNWYLDYQSYMNKTHPNWLSSNVFGNFRREFQAIDQNNTENYFKTLGKFEVPINKVGSLQFALTEDKRLEIESSRILTEGLDKDQQSNFIAFTDRMLFPMLHFIVDFDEQLYIVSYSNNAEVEATTVFAPKGWTCYYAKQPIEYLPNHIVKAF